MTGGKSEEGREARGDQCNGSSLRGPPLVPFWPCIYVMHLYHASTSCIYIMYLYHVSCCFLVELIKGVALLSWHCFPSCTEGADTPSHSWNHIAGNRISNAIVANRRYGE